MPKNSRAAAPPKPPRPHPSDLLKRPAIELHYTQRTKQSTDGPSSTIQDTPRPDKKKRPALLERKVLLSSELVDAKILAAMDAEARKAEMGKMKQAIGPPKRPQPNPPQPEPEAPETPRKTIKFNRRKEERLRRKAREEAKQRDKLFSKRRSGSQKPASSRRRRRGTRRNRRISRRKRTRKKKRTN